MLTNTLNDVVQITGELSGVETLNGEISASGGLTSNIGLPTIVRPAAYTGEYTITPTAETQTLETSELYMTDNITINPIPSNYGLITWDGSTLTVS